jgi:hypothetical protein
MTNIMLEAARKKPRRTCRPGEEVLASAKPMRGMNSASITSVCSTKRSQTTAGAG